VGEDSAQVRRTPAAVAVGVVTLVAVVAVTSAMVGARLLPAEADDGPPRPIAVGESVDGQLGGRPDRWVVSGTADETVVIELHRRGDGLDPFLRLSSPGGMALAEDDDGAGDLNSRIRHTFGEDGEHTIHAAGLGRSRGAYTLTVRSAEDSR
jgi:hypothetical protein